MLSDSAVVDATDWGSNWLVLCSNVDSRDSGLPHATQRPLVAPYFIGHDWIRGCIRAGEDDPEQPRHILTETGIGYRLAAP